MKTTLIIAILSAAALAFLSGCTADGSFDSAGFGSAVSSVSKAYQDTQGPRIVGYDAMGQPIWR